MSSELDVFISYSTKNKSVADAIVSNFENNGIRCWYAPRGMGILHQGCIEGGEGICPDLYGGIESLQAGHERGGAGLQRGNDDRTF